MWIIRFSIPIFFSTWFNCLYVIFHRIISKFIVLYFQYKWRFMPWKILLFCNRYLICWHTDCKTAMLLFFVELAKKMAECLLNCSGRITIKKYNQIYLKMQNFLRFYVIFLCLKTFFCCWHKKEPAKCWLFFKFQHKYVNFVKSNWTILFFENFFNSVKKMAQSNLWKIIFKLSANATKIFWLCVQKWI